MVSDIGPRWVGGARLRVFCFSVMVGVGRPSTRLAALGLTALSRNSRAQPVRALRWLLSITAASTRSLSLSRSREREEGWRPEFRWDDRIGGRQTRGCQACAWHDGGVLGQLRARAT